MQPDPKQLVETALALPESNAQRSFLLRVSFTSPDLPLSIAEQLKKQFDRYLQESIQRAEQLADLLAWYAAVHIEQPFIRALSLRAAGSLLFFQGDGNYQDAIGFYDEAAGIYEAHNEPYLAAQSQIGKITCLGYVGEAEQALQLGETLRQKFEAWGDRERVFQVVVNTQLLLYRLGRARESLKQLDTARQLAIDFNLDQYLTIIELNRAGTLRDLGELELAEQASLEAERLCIEQQQMVNAVHARYNRAIIYFLQNRYNEALTLFDTVREEYLRDRRMGDLHWVNLAVTNCLLQLGRFKDVLALCDVLETEFNEIGSTNELANVHMCAANAHAGLRAFPAALQTLDKALQIFEASDDRVWAAICNVERASILVEVGQSQEALNWLASCYPIFESHDLLLRLEQARLVQAKAHLACQNWHQAEQLATTLLAESSSAWIQFESHVLLGDLASQSERESDALAAYQNAITLLEKLRGRLITEYRADFVEDKQRVYEAVVAILVAQNRPVDALQYVERAKSRALVDLIAYNLDLRIQPRSEADREQVERLTVLQQRRNVLYRRWISGDDNKDDIQQRIGKLEGEITAVWHNLLIHNADYARDAAIATVRSEPIQPYLQPDTLLIEFFQLGKELVVFLVCHDAVEVVSLPSAWRKVANLSRTLNLNFKAVSTGRRDAKLLPHAQRVLKQLYDILIAPFENTIGQHKRLIIVPHGAALHYLPFQALYDGERYLCEQVEISYLPSASLLHYRNQPRSADKTIAFGYSNQNTLPHAVEEASWIAEDMGGRAFVESRATLQQIEISAETARILHFSTHGDFNQHNPLFSGLSFADGQLNTLDIFNLRLNASLVTLSACQTGRNVIKGGDEIMGLTRAFLYAGAQSLLLSLWRVADQSTLQWMQHFYRQLKEHATKGEALKATQAHFIHHQSAYQHPYFWAPFFLVGDSGTL